MRDRSVAMGAVRVGVENEVEESSRGVRVCGCVNKQVGAG